ncbi:cation:proton antiporter [Novipirellula sp. SH528]|uniref:cation:proton antiporter domain-containing protein n=1 Tax=Novipirellula sp. SH528 TaxID=3454466 RepID=UPI003FA1557C
MHHGPEFTVVLIFGLALAIGAAMRLVLSRVRFPYTIAMLLIGLAAGFAIQATIGNYPAANGPSHVAEHVAGGAHENSATHTEDAEQRGLLFDLLLLIGAAGQISPDLIIFVFVPALVFESAFNLEVHRFRKNAGAVLVLAVPALLLATVATAGLMVVLTGSTWGWAWLPALVFGALISATDPVAVVAILSELGVSKRLGVLIEGESLLNDASAIVVFSILLTLLTGATESIGVGSALFEFIRVSFGGLLVGVALSWAISSWIGRVFNDPLTEITLTLVLAYGCMVIGEGFFHVSGVTAVVVAGLWMSGWGRTQISPEVAHFLHRFWQMLGYIANTLIFFLVGLAMAPAIKTAEISDLVLIVLAWVGIMAIRFVLVFATQPINTRLSEGITTSDSTLIAWGGLRGAVSLALALAVSQNEAVAPLLRDQILLVSVGVVLLTILINGTTIGWFLARLGFAEVPPTEQLARLTARSRAIAKVGESLEELSASRDLRTVRWRDVESRLVDRRAALASEIENLEQRLALLPESERAVSYWRQVLTIERRTYWEAFELGTLSARAVRILAHEIDAHLDRLDRGDLKPPTARTPEIHSSRVTQGLSFLRSSRFGFAQVELVFELSRAETLGAERVLASLAAFAGAPPAVMKAIRETYMGYLRGSKERIEDFRNNTPEMASACESRLARRIELNIEREAFEHLGHDGVLDESAVESEIEDVESRMHRLMRSPTIISLPSIAELVASTPLFRSLEPSALDALSRLAEEQVFPAGTWLWREGDRGDSLIVIARGAVHVFKHIEGEDAFLDVLGGGDVVGEIALLTGEPRSASIRASTAVTVGVVGRDAFHQLMKLYPSLHEELWRALTRRRFCDCSRQLPELSHLNQRDRLRWVDTGRRIDLDAGQSVSVAEEDAWAFVLIGAIESSGARYGGGSLFQTESGATLKALETTRLVLLPHGHSEFI